jgi:acyl-CoA thioesterase
MGAFASIDEARKYFEADRFATVNGMTVDELTDDVCVCSMTIRPEHRNAVGGVMGGVTFTLADFAFAVASNHARKGTVGLHSSIEYLSGVKGGRLIASAVRVKSGRTTCVYEVTVTDDTGRKIALFIGTGYTV